jgi:two-component system, chemotaxis family, sensor kinase CheA
MHMVRNAVDHGIETPDERALAHKPRRGTITLSAIEDEEELVVELHDDGRGLHRERIVAKGVERGLIESEHGLRDADIFALIFVPGFTTAERVTDVSGRGVGMDVVRRNLDALHGRIEIRSDAMHGTTFVLRVPLTTVPREAAQPDHDEPSLFPVLSPNALDACSRKSGRTDAVFNAS